MILPPSYVAAGPATPIFENGPATPSPTSGSPGFTPENWSSLIGIITAIVGNIMISFALNMQRYAHLRLEREWQEKERARKRRNASLKRSQAKRADERSSESQGRKYSPHRHDEYANGDGRESSDEEYIATESDPLLPSNLNATLSPRSRSSDSLSDLPNGDAGHQQETYKQKSYLKSPYWWAGIILMTTGEAGNFLAYGFAPASIVSPLGVVALISNCIIAPILLKEPFRKRDGFGVLVAVAGAVTVVLSASDNNPKLGPDEIWDLITRWEFETYLGVTIAVIIGLLWASNEYGEKSILIDLGLVGLFGGYTALSTKGVASMLSYTLWRAITFPVTYLLVLILVGTAIMQIKYVNRALQRFDATQVIPVQFVLFTLSVILGSAILYRDFERTSSGDAGKFVGGCAMTFLGVWLITSGRSRPINEEEEDREPEPEDAINLVEERYHDNVEDGVSEEVSVPSTERTSRLRASSPPITIDTRVLDQHRTLNFDAPDITFTPVSGVPQTPPSGRATPMVPASLTANPWEQEAGADSPSARQAPPLLSRHTTLSTPVLLSEAGGPPMATTSDPELVATSPRPQTPNRNHSDNSVIVTPTTGTVHRLRRTVTSERTGARNSIPGPLLASPLSTSLSAMVQDLKRGGSIKSPHTHREDGAVRRRESVLGIGASEAENTEIGEPLGRRRTATDEVPRPEDPAATGTVSGRGRSLSGTLNDLWKGIRGSGFPDVDGAQEDPERQERR